MIKLRVATMLVTSVLSAVCLVIGVWKRDASTTLWLSSFLLNFAVFGLVLVYHEK